MRYADLALLLIPAGLAIAWLSGVRGLSRRGILVALALLCGLGGMLLWLGADRGFIGHYEPAHLSGTRIVPGHPG
jgi:hypothetical protein